MSAAFLYDTALYYIFLVTPAYRFNKAFVPARPVLARGVLAIPSYALMRFLKWRFVRIAGRRRAGEAGRRDGRRLKAYFNLNLAPFHMLMRRGCGCWRRRTRCGSAPRR